jgi:hypothetical protein
MADVTASSLLEECARVCDTLEETLVTFENRCNHENDLSSSTISSYGESNAGTVPPLVAFITLF